MNNKEQAENNMNWDNENYVPVETKIAEELEFGKDKMGIVDIVKTEIVDAPVEEKKVEIPIVGDPVEEVKTADIESISEENDTEEETEYVEEQSYQSLCYERMRDKLKRKNRRMNKVGQKQRTLQHKRSKGK